MANRGKLLGIGESFEFKLMSIVRSTFPDAIILHDLRFGYHGDWGLLY